MPKSPAGYARTTCRTLRNHPPGMRNHLSDAPEARAGRAGTTYWTDRNHLTDPSETPAEHAGKTCSTRRSHLLATPISPAGYARTTCWTLRNHLRGMPEPPLRRATTMCRTRRKHLLDTTEADRKSTRLNSSHANISYAVFCLKKKVSTLSLLLSFV